MISITNQKIAGFDPRWAKFQGYSLLFDNPGHCLVPSDSLLNLTCQVDTDPDLGFYHALNNSISAIGREMMTRSYLFCPLPPASYHVTVWDGGNDANVADVAPGHRSELEALLKSLPMSLATKTSLTDIVMASSLAAYNSEISFRFDRLVKWGNNVLVAKLMPSEGMEAQLQEIVELRSNLSQEFAELSALKVSKQYSPHVSLGYFANPESAQQATPCINEWSAIVHEQIGSQSLCFNSISLYGFTDMAHFFKTNA